MMSNTLKPAVKPAQIRCFDLHPLYATILTDGGVVREGDVLGLDNDLSHVVIAPFAGTVRLLVTGQGSNRCVKAYLTEGVTNRRGEALPLRDGANYRDRNRN